MLESEKYKNTKNKRKRCAYIIAGVVFQTIIILVFAMTVMRIKTPSVRLRSVTIQDLQYNSSSSPSFNLTLIAEIAVKNKNFGHFRFDNSTVNVTYGGVIVGDGEIIKGRASARKTKRMNVTVDVRSNVLSDNTNSGILTLSSHASLRGKVTLMKVMKKRNTAKMNCTMSVNLTSWVVQDWDCE